MLLSEQILQLNPTNSYKEGFADALFMASDLAVSIDTLLYRCFAVLSNCGELDLPPKLMADVEALCVELDKF